MSDYREKALEEYGSECTNCGATDPVVVHHKDGDRTNNGLDNLVPLCESCHGKVHGRSIEMPDLVRELGYKPREQSHTTIQINPALADELYSRKGRGESYEDVLWELLESVGD